MKLNEECIRDILFYLEDSLVIKDGKEFSTITLNQLQEALSDKYAKDDVFYSVYNLHEIHFIEGRIKDINDMKMFFCEINNITYLGHQFLNTVRPEPIWDKTKNVVAKVGNHTLGFIEKVAHDIAVESAKQAVAVMMGQIQ